MLIPTVFLHNQDHATQNTVVAREQLNTYFCLRKINIFSTFIYDFFNLTHTVM